MQNQSQSRRPVSKPLRSSVDYITLLVVEIIMRFKQRRNFLPTFLFSLLLWALVFYFLVSFPPLNFWYILVFYVVFFLSTLITISLLLGHTRRGLLFSLGIVSFLVLNQIKQAHLLNYLLFGGLFLSIELYLSKK